MAAADGFRLSVRKAELSSPSSSPITAVIPARALSELARIVRRWRPVAEDGAASRPRPGDLPPEAMSSWSPS